MNDYYSYDKEVSLLCYDYGYENEVILTFNDNDTIDARVIGSKDEGVWFDVLRIKERDIHDSEWKEWEAVYFALDSMASYLDEWKDYVRVHKPGMLDVFCRCWSLLVD